MVEKGPKELSAADTIGHLKPKRGKGDVVKAVQKPIRRRVLDEGIVATDLDSLFRTEPNDNSVNFPNSHIIDKRDRNQRIQRDL